MAIQELNRTEIEAVSGGVLLNVSATVGSLLDGVAGLLSGVLAATKVLVGAVSTFLTGLPVVGSLLGSLLGAVGGIITL